MSVHYQEIIDSMNQKRPDLLFPVEWLNTLTEEERKEVEKTIIKNCLLGVSIFLPYISELKIYSPELIFTPETMVALESYQKATIYRTLYQKTNDPKYLDYIIELAKMDFNVYSMLSFLYKEKKDAYLYNELKSIMELSNDTRYRDIFRKRIGDDNMAQEDKPILDAVHAGVLGFAVGDALGVPVEFTSRQARKLYPVEDMIGNGTHHVPSGTWSDDTSMTIAAMDAISHSGTIHYDSIMQAFCNWATRASYTATDTVFDIGNTTRMALGNYYNKKAPALECGAKDDRSNGNGSLMRMLPVVYYLYCNHLSREEEVKIVGEYSGLTHGHEISKMGCLVYYDFMKGLLQGKSKEEAFEALGQNDYSKYYSSDTIDLYKRVLDGSLKNVNETDISSSGYVVNTLEASLWSTLNSSTYSGTVLKAVNLGNDTDTVGAITGSMAGTIYGKEAIPNRWLSQLKKLGYIQLICDSYCKAVDKNHYYISSKFDDDFIKQEEDSTGSAAK